MSGKELLKNIESIVNTGKVNKVFQYLSENDQMGWEKWIQYELAFALTEYGEPEVEFKFTFDKTVSVSLKRVKNENGFIDILFRRKNQAKEYFLALELKLGRSDKVLRALVSDLIKISACKRRDWQYRSVVALAIVRDDSVKKTKFSRAAQHLIDNNLLQVRGIKNTNFKLLMLDWSVAPRNVSRENFKNWLKEIVKELMAHDVKVDKAKVKSFKNS